MNFYIGFEITILVFVLLLQVSKLSKIRLFLKERKKRIPCFSRYPSVSIIIPCKGIDERLEENLNAVMCQDYPDYSVVFVTAEKDDPVYPVLSAFCERRKNTKLLVAGINPQRGQKVNNLLYALHDPIVQKAEIIAFMDSDCQPKPTWLREIVYPLLDHDVGITTGSQWYIPHSRNIVSWLRAMIGNIGGVPKYLSEKMVCGAAMAIRRETIEKIDIEKIWSMAISDDLSLAREILKMGLEIRFIPECLCYDYSDITLRDFFQWLWREVIILKVYAPHVWKTVFVFILPYLMVPVGISLLILSVFYRHLFIHGMIISALIPILTIGGIITALYFNDKRTALWAISGAVVGGFLSSITVLFSIFGKTITWRGIKYKLISNDKFFVLKED